MVMSNELGCCYVLVFRRTPEQLMESHVRDLQQQISKRDETIDRLRAEIDKIHREQLTSQEVVSDSIVL